MFERVPLGFELNALEPYIDAETMDYHYNKHYATYTKKFNDLVDQVPALKGKSAEEILSNLSAIPLQYRTGIRNNGGGYLNHSLYFSNLSPNGGGEPKGPLGMQIAKDYGSFAAFKDIMSKEGSGQFGSGWAWLVADSKDALSVSTSPNQDTPVNYGKFGTLLNLDVWEHAYYLKYKNLRDDYIKAFWHVVGWDKVEARYAMIK